jgi:dipeptidyl aminopeptidase/acylaminoacyl peptidase
MKHTLTNLPIEAFVDSEQISDLCLSPDGKYIAFVLGQTYKNDASTALEQSIYILETASKNLRLLTTKHSGSNHQPHWSPDSQQLVFISNRTNPPTAQLYTISLHGGEAQALSNLCGRLNAPTWSPDGNNIAFLYRAEGKGTEPIVVDAEPAFDRLWIVSSESREQHLISPEDYHIFEYAWSPDGTKLVVLASQQPNPAEAWYSAQIYLLNLNGTMQQISAMAHQIGRLRWSPDASQIAFISGVMSDEGNISGEIYLLSVDAGEAHCITAGIEHSITWIEWQDDEIIYAGRHIDSLLIGAIHPQTKKLRQIFKRMASVSVYGPDRFQLTTNRCFAILLQSFSQVPTIYAGNLDEDWQPLFKIEMDEALIPPLHVESRHWLSPDGTEVQGFLVFPPNYDASKSYPLFVHVHGGPALSFLPAYLSPWERLLIARDCLVLMPNPRGSWGRGLAYQTANIGDLGGGDWQDIQAGIDALIAEGLADPDCLAIGGWSYGGYLVAWAVTQTQRFRCAIAGASITSYESNYGLVSNREWQSTMFGSNVYDDYERHRSRSPIAFVNQVKTPTLLLHGQEDKHAPVGQSMEFYIALKHFGVPSQLAIYPREPHAFEERAHQIDLYQRIGNWLDQYLFSS